MTDSVPQDNCMPESSLLTQRKRARATQHAAQQGEASSPAKRIRGSPRCGFGPAFWDKLSRIWLTKRALRELDRRNNQVVPSASRPLQKLSSIASERGEIGGLCSDNQRLLRALKAFGRHGGPDLSHLRNFSEPVHITKHTMSRWSTQGRARDAASASTPPTANTARTKNTGVYNRDFEQHLIDYEVYPHGYRHPDGSEPVKPANWDDINETLRQPRPSLTPSVFTEGDYKRFMHADVDAKKEKQVSELVIPLLEGRIQDAKCRSGGIPFTNLEPLTGDPLKPGNPDVYYGARPEQLSRQVRAELSGKIVPSTQHDLPMVPNFFLAAKGPGGSLEVAGSQACYDGALGARGMASLEEYGQGGLAYGTARTISSIYHGGQLKMYTTHVAEPSSPGGQPRYYTTQINAWAVAGSADAFRQGARAYRNAREWAREQRNELISEANKKRAACRDGDDVRL